MTVQPLIENDKLLSKKPRATLVICTRNPGQKILSTLLSVEHQQETTGWHETVIIDQSDDPRLAVHALQSNVLKWSTTRYIRQSNTGLSKARNEAIRRSSGDIIIFVDDDVDLFPGHVQQYIDIFGSHTSLGFAFAPVLSDITLSQHGVIPNCHIMAYQAANAELPLHISSKRRFGMGANFAMTRKAAHLFPFDEKLGAGAEFPSMEDLDVPYRMLKWAIRYPDLSFGLRVGTFSQPQVIHRGLRYWGSEVKDWANSTARAGGAFDMKHAMLGDTHSWISVTTMWLYRIKVAITLLRKREGLPTTHHKHESWRSHLEGLGIGRIPAYYRGVYQCCTGYKVDKKKGLLSRRATSCY